jgi:hypothetical protein
MTLLEIARRAKMLRDTPDSEERGRSLRTDEKYEQIIHPRAPGSSPDCPMLDVPAGGWRWAVANWPHDRWSAWRQRATAILAEADAAIRPEDRAEAPRPDAEEIRRAERRAFDEMTRPSFFAGVTFN